MRSARRADIEAYAAGLARPASAFIKAIDVIAKGGWIPAALDVADCRGPAGSRAVTA